VTCGQCSMCEGRLRLSSQGSGAAAPGLAHAWSTPPKHPGAPTSPHHTRSTAVRTWSRAAANKVQRTCLTFHENAGHDTSLHQCRGVSQEHEHDMCFVGPQHRHGECAGLSRLAASVQEAFAKTHQRAVQEQSTSQVTPQRTATHVPLVHTLQIPILCSSSA
jgi:hypothetical protein